MNDYIIVIPARLQSTRLKEKLLIKLDGIEILIRTYMQCLKVLSKDKIIIATDSAKIAKVCNKYNAQYILTGKKCPTGTDRISEVAKKIKKNFYINVQGDEPFLHPPDLRKFLNVINGFAKIKDKSDYFNNSIPKIVFNKFDELLYMSRSPLPGNKENKFYSSHKQICLYSFPRSELFKFSQQGKKTKLESEEDLESIRFLEIGTKIKLVELSGRSFAIDTKKDLEKAKKFLKKTKF